MAPKPKRVKNKDNARRAKKKISILTQESVDYVDYKDINLLRRFMSDRAKIRAHSQHSPPDQTCDGPRLARGLRNPRPRLVPVGRPGGASRVPGVEGVQRER